MKRSNMIEQMRTHRDRAIPKAKLLAEDPHCGICRQEVRQQYGHDNSAIVADGVLKCQACVSGTETTATVTIVQTLPRGCKECGGDLPANSTLKTCADCLRVRRVKYQECFAVTRKKRSVKTSRPVDYAKSVDYQDGQTIYAIPDGATPEEMLLGMGLSRCPLCGYEIDADSIGCYRHATILLMRKLKAVERFSG